MLNLLKKIKEIILFIHLPENCRLFRKHFHSKRPILEKVKVIYLTFLSFLSIYALNYACN